MNNERSLESRLISSFKDVAAGVPELPPLPWHVYLDLPTTGYVVDIAVQASRMPRLRILSRNRAVGITALVVSACGVGAGVAAASGAFSSPDAATQTRSVVAAIAPDLLLPPDQRTLWVEDFQAMADCYHAHGVPDFPNAPRTFGDGKTAMPVTDGPAGSEMDPASPTFQAASQECKFDSSNLSQSAFARLLAALAR